MSGYVIANDRIVEQAGHESCPAAAVATFLSFGGEAPVATHAPEALEGSTGTTMEALRIPSPERAREWFDSVEYRTVIDRRRNDAEGWLVVADGFVPPKGR